MMLSQGALECLNKILLEEHVRRTESVAKFEYAMEQGGGLVSDWKESVKALRSLENAIQELDLLDQSGMDGSFQ